MSALVRRVLPPFILSVLALLSPPSASGSGTLLHRYSFTSDVSDSVGSSNGTLMATAAISSGSVLLDGSTGYVDLPNGLLVGLTNASFETWLTDKGSGNWSRIIDFGCSTGGEGNMGTGTNYLFLTPQSGTGVLRAGIKVGSGTEYTVDYSGTRLATGSQKHVVLTIDGSAQTARLFVDGELVGENTNFLSNPAQLGYTFNNWLGRSQWTSDAYLYGAISEFRMYEGALTPAEVKLNYTYGPEVALTAGPVTILSQPQSLSVGELQPASLSLVYGGTRPIRVQWYRNNVAIAGATNDTYAMDAAALTNNGAVYKVALTNQFTNTTFGVVSSNATLTVMADLAAPSLVRAASLFPSEVLVTFSEGVRADTATNIANYAISYPGGSLSISSARFGTGASNVILSTTAQKLGTNYVLTVNGVRDLAGAANQIAANSQASFVGTTFFGQDIGNAGSDGVFTVISNGYALSSSGSGVGGSQDQFTFAAEWRTNDFDLQVRVSALLFSSAWARAGLMARDGLATNALFAATLATPGPAGCYFAGRDTVGGNASLAGSFPVNYPDTWLRLRRVGNVFDGFASLDGVTWEFLGTATIAMSSNLQVGFMLAAGTTASGTSTLFQNFGSGSGTVVTNGALPFEPLGPCSRRTALVISEIMYNPPDSWGGTNSLEFVELWNSGLITEDLTGHKLTGDIAYTFPDGTKLAPGQFAVVARDPAAAQSYYGVSCLGPYTNKLPNSGGTVRLMNEVGGTLLEIQYDTQAPWPVAPDGAGHSLVLSRPSYGENNPRAWSASDVIGGSPGAFEHRGAEPARAVVINEFLAHTDDPQVDFVELFNTSSQAVDLSGAWLSDEAGTNKYRIPNGTTIVARGRLAYTETQLGFGLAADGEHIFLVNSNRTRVLDAVAFDGQENGVSMGRYPDGAPGFQALSAVTLGTSNAAPLPRPVVINEIMYHPISELEDDEYVELYNRAATNISLANWKLKDGISFTFPTNAVIPTGGYVVVGKNLTNLLEKYSQLNRTNAFGDFSGALKHGGERIALAMPDDLITTNSSGVRITNIFYITVNEVSYSDGGRWGRWSDGGGSSLELIDPHADNRIGASWADSDETAKAAWTTIDVTNILENGQTAAMVNEGTYYGMPTRFEFFLQGEGESLVDNLVFLNNSGSMLLTNGTFELGTNGWSAMGVLRNSYAQSGVGVSGSKALHLVSEGRGDAGPNKVVSTLLGGVATNSPNTGTIRASVRWLKGSPYALFRLRGHWMEVSTRLNVPSNCGTPGLPNSRYATNAGPAIVDVTPSPVLPAAGQPVVISARCADPDGVGSVVLRYRFDPSASYTAIPMTDNGTGGDAVAGDGLYSATIPGQVSNTLAAFYITAGDNAANSATTMFPAQAPLRECHVRWGESAIGGSLGTYRLWVTSSNLTFWANREKNANDTLDATFVYGNLRAVYNVDTMYSGSPFHTPGYNGPMGSMASDYEVNFHSDDPFLGETAFVLTAFDVASTSYFMTEKTGQGDLTGNWIARKLGQPYDYRRHIHMVMNGMHRGTIYDDAQQPNKAMLDQYWPSDDGVQLRKVEDWFEFADDTSSLGITTATLTRFNKSDGSLDAKRYRFNWRLRASDDPDNWAPFTNLVAAVNASNAPNYPSLVRTWMDVPNFLRPIVTHHICGDWDSYGYERGKNMFACKPGGQGWRLMMWDIEMSLGFNSDAATDSIYNILDPTLRWMITNTPAIHREYLRGYREALDGPLVPGVAAAVLDERYASLVQNNVFMVSPAAIEAYLSARRNYLLTVVPSAEFAVANAAYQTVSGSNMITLSGTGSLSTEEIVVNGVSYAVTWTSVTNWTVTVPLASGSNTLAVTAKDRKGVALTNASASVVANYTGTAPSPEGYVVFNEVMYRPALAGAEYVELFNTHSNCAFDLSGWTLHGLDYTFPSGATLWPRGYLTLAKDRFAYSQAYGLTNTAFGQFAGVMDTNGETLTLYHTNSGSTNRIVVDRVRYETVAPWPTPSVGSSLQLIDAARDNARVANWGVRDFSTNVSSVAAQWVYVTNTATLNNSASSFYFYLGSAGDIYLDDVKLVSGTVPGSGVNLLTNGDFETALSGYWTLSANFTTSALSTTVKHEGNASLHMVATAAGSGTGNAVIHALSPALTSGSTYTLSFWYLQSTNGTPLTARVSNGSASAGVYVSFDPRYSPSVTTISQGATPGWANSCASNLAEFPSVWLNELQADNVTGPLDNASQHDPWVEAYNTSSNALSLTNYYLTDTYTNLTKWPFPTNAIAGSNGFALVWCDAQTNQATNALHSSFRLASGAGSVVLSRLISNQVQIVDYLNYTNLSANWSYGDVPDAQPFYRQTMFYVTPGATNSGASAPIQVYINEWLADNAGSLADPADGNYEDWFELYNPGTNAVDLGGFYLTDDLTNKTKFLIPANGHYQVPAGGYLLVWADNESSQNSTNLADLHVNFALSKSGEAIGLYAADGTAIDAVTFRAQTTDVSQGRFPNGTAAIFSMPTPTPRAANVVPNTAPQLAAITNRVMTLGQTLSFYVNATDTDLPSQTLTYSLSGANGGASMNASTGLFTWKPSAAPATNIFTVVVTDNGTPNMSATNTFTVAVGLPPTVSALVKDGSQLRFSWATLSGQSFQVECKADLSDAVWTPVGSVISGTGGLASFTNQLDAATPQRFFRVRVLP
jgi:hypothetical protein